MSTSALSLHWSGGYVILSYCVATLGSMVSLELMKQRTSHKGKRNMLLLLGGSIALGMIGIWSMHFIGMMALEVLDENGTMMQMGFIPWMTALSAVMPIIICSIGFIIAGDPNTPRIWKNFVAGAAGGIGVSVMHYLGMLSMVMKADSVWDGGIITGSVLIGITAATAAMFILFKFGRYWNEDLRLQFITACIMGVAVCGMHYTGMQSIKLYSVGPDHPNHQINFNDYASRDELLIIIITLVSTTIIALVAFRIHYRVLLRRELDKSQCLTLAAIILNENGEEMYLGPTGAPPSVIIDRSYIDSSTFDQSNPNFLRMFRTSFDWNSMEEYLIHLRASFTAKQAGTSNSKIDSNAVRLYEKFVNASEELSKQLNVPVHLFGKLYWQPENSLLTIIFTCKGPRANPNTANSNNGTKAQVGPVSATEMTLPGVTTTVSPSKSTRVLTRERNDESPSGLVMSMAMESPKQQALQPNTQTSSHAWAAGSSKLSLNHYLQQSNTSYRSQNIVQFAKELHQYLRLDDGDTLKEWVTRRIEYVHKIRANIMITADEDIGTKSIGLANNTENEKEQKLSTLQSQSELDEDLLNLLLQAGQVALPDLPTGQLNQLAHQWLTILQERPFNLPSLQIGGTSRNSRKYSFEPDSTIVTLPTTAAGEPGPTPIATCASQPDSFPAGGTTERPDCNGMKSLKSNPHTSIRRMSRPDTLITPGTIEESEIECPTSIEGARLQPRFLPQLQISTQLQLPPRSPQSTLPSPSRLVSHAGTNSLSPSRRQSQLLLRTPMQGITPPRRLSLVDANETNQNSTNQTNEGTRRNSRFRLSIKTASTGLSGSGGTDPSGFPSRITSISDLSYLSRYPSRWTCLDLPAVVKGKLLPMLTEMGRTARTRLHVGVYYTQASRGRGLQVLIPKSGPFGMLPHKSLQSSNSTKEVRLDDARTLLADLMAVLMVMKGEDCEISPISDIVSNADGVKSILNQLQTAPPMITVPDGGGQQPSEKLSLPNFLYPCVTPDAPMSPNRSDGGGCDSLLQSPLASPSFPPSDKLNPSPSPIISSSLLLLRKNFFSRISELSESIGSSADMTLSNLYPSLVRITPDTHMLIFVVCKMSPVLPEHLCRTNKFIPLPLFEIIHRSSAFKLARKKGYIGKKEMMRLHELSQWTRTLLGQQVKLKNVVGVPSSRAAGGTMIVTSQILDNSRQGDFGRSIMMDESEPCSKSHHIDITHAS